jgi:acetyl-CoA C-acetyltransferase
VDAVYVGVMNPEAFTGEGNLAVVVTDALGLEGVPAVRIETASSTGATAFHQACLAIASGHARRVLVVAGEKMTHLPTARTTAILAEVIDHEERGAGATMPALAALVTRCYMARHGLGVQEMTRALAAVAVKNHANGVKNPYAQFRRAITEGDYAASKPVATPLRLYDCAPITDGAAAVVLSSEPTGGRAPGVRVIGLGHATDTIALRYRSSLTGFKSTRLAASQAYAMAGVRPADVSFAEVHDAFTPFEILGTEDLGFFEDGQGGRAALEGVTSAGGRLPVNPSGGLKARGHPVGASGLAQVVEAVWQLRGEAGEARQLPAPSVGLVQSIGGLANNNLVAILDRADRGRVHALPPVPLGLEERSVPRGEPEALGGARLESFTVLHVRADGEQSPLVLGLVTAADGRRLLARGLSEAGLAVGAPVTLARDGYRYAFSVQSPVERLVAQVETAVGAVARPVRAPVRWLRRLRRAAARPATN